MYHGRPPPRGGYPPRPTRPYPAPDYRDDRSRPRPPYHHGFHEHGLPDPHRRSPPRRSYPSTGPVGHRGGEYRPGGPPREMSPSPHESVPINHNLVITVGNELTAAPGPTPLRHHDRDFPAQPEYKRSRDRSLDRSRAKSRGRSKSRPRSRSRSPDRSRAKSRGRSKSRPRSRSHSPDWSRAKSRPRSRSRSPDRSRAKSRGRSKSRPRSRSRSPDWSRAKSRRRSQSRSPDRSRAKSRGRSKSRRRSQSRSPDPRRAKSWARSKSRARSPSSPVSRSKSRSRSRGRSRGCSSNRAVSHSHRRSRSVSSSSSSSSRSCSEDKSYKKEFTELETARRRKELEEMLTLPTKSILKKRTDSEDSPSIRSIDSPRRLEGSNVSQVVEQLLQAVHGMEPQMVATVLAELQSDPQMARRAGIDTELKEILNLLGGSGVGAGAEKKTVDDIDDEEKFLYGDSEDPKPPPMSEPVRHHGLDLYGDVTEETLYGDYPPAKSATGQSYSLPPGSLPPSQAPPSTPELDSKFAGQLTTSSDQSVSIQRSNPAPPTTEALEYEKIQDLLKTIGLDLGVAEIGKMAARTKERLHGNKPPTKTPARRRRYSSGSSDSSQGIRRQSRSGSSSSSSRSRSRSHSQGGKRGGRRGGSWSSQDSRRTSAPPNSHKDRDKKEPKAQQTIAALQYKEPPPKTSDPISRPPGVLVPTYPPPQVHATMPPNYPPPGYGQYGNYLPFMHQPPMYPPMYPPPNMSMPPPASPEDFPTMHPYNEPYHMTAPDSGPKGSVRSAQVGAKGTFALDSQDSKASEEQNNQSQKQKVLEEREKLKQEREIRMKKKEYLMKELERLRKQQGELLRRKRRERDGHKDPLLQEISHLQEEVMSQISNLRKEHEAAEKKRSEIEKVALILGLSPADRPKRVSKPAEAQEGGLPAPPPEKKKQEPERSPAHQQLHLSSTLKTLEAPLLRASSNKEALIAPPATPPPEPFEYYDAGNHWCKDCNVTSGSMFDFFTHLHSKTHRKTLDPYDRPWASTPTKILKNTPPEEKLTKPAKGSEFLVPVRGFFCLLCKEFYGDAICAEEHVTTHAHNDKYKKQMYENPLYEQRRNLDRQAGLASETSAKKRKHEDSEKGSKDKEGRIKHKKEKKDKEKKEEDDTDAHNEEKSKGKQEEEENRPMCYKTEELKSPKSQEEDRSSFTKKDDNKSYTFTKRDDRYRCSEDERGDRYKYSKEKDSRRQYRRNIDDRYDDRPKSGSRDDDKYKSSKYLESRPTYDRKQDEEKPRAEKEAFKKPELGKPAGKSDLSKPELPPKPHDTPKIFCGPSPAMRAKLRKQSLEAGKPAPASTAATFGKFIWKKKESALSAVAEKMAAEFIKEDEAAVTQQPVSAQDSIAKSRAFAKEIAEKLGDHQIPAPFVSNGANRGRIRPNLPPPAAVLRKTTLMGKPASLNNFLSIRPQNTGFQGPSPKDVNDIVPNVLNSQSAQLEAKSVDNSKPVPTEPTPSEAKHAQSPVIQIVSDVAAPGVPESEQTRTVFVKPPPFMNMSERGQRSEKHTSNLAAAKALELFGIFYSNTGHISPSSITKPDSSADKNSANKSPLLVPQAPQLQPQPLTHIQPESPTGLHKSPKLDSNSSSQSPQSQPKPDVPSASVWSLKCSIAPPPEDTSSVTTQTKPTLSADSDAHTEDQSSTSKSHINPQIEPAEPEQVPKFDPHCELDQDTQSWSHLETHPDTSPEHELKPSLKNRGKKTSSPVLPVRQTRYQTRRQQQSQSETEPELASGDSESAPSDQTGQDTSDPGSQSEQGAPNYEITPEALVLPSDLTS